MEENVFKKRVKNEKQKKKIPFHYDDKGRKVYDVSSIRNNPKAPEETKQVIVKPKCEDLSYLKPRETNNVSTPTEIIKPVTKEEASKSAFYCKICNCSLQDNQAYLDHLNGKRHNLMIGMNMKVEKVGVDKVREKLLNLKRKNDGSKEDVRVTKSKQDLEELEKII